MRFRRLMAASMAGVMAVSSAIVCQISASAAAVDKPDGSETVIAAVDLTGKKTSFTTKYENGDWVQANITDTSIMTKDNVYVKVTVQNLGSVETDNGETPWSDVFGWGFSGWNWAGTVKWYNNNTDKTTGDALPENFEVTFTPTTGSTVSEAVCYAPITDFALTTYNAIAGNIQAAHTAGVTLKSIEIVEVSAAVAPELPVNKFDFDTASGTVEANTWGQPASSDVGADKTITPEVLGGDFIIAVPYISTVKPEIVFSNSGGETDPLNWVKNNPNCVVDGTAYYLKSDLVSTWTAAGGEADLSDLKKIYVGAGAAELTVTGVALYSDVEGKIAVESVTLDQTTATIQKGKTLTLNATVKPDDADDPTVTWTSSKTDVATVDSDGVVTAVAEGTAIITAKAGEKSATCTVTVDKTDAELIAAAKTAAETELGGFSATNSTTPDNIGTVVSSAVLNINRDIEVTVNDADFQITKATETAAGSITGKVTLKKGTETAEVTVSLEIAKLPVDDASRVAAAKTATEKVLSGITATNDTKEADVLAKITEAISDTKATAAITGFKVTPATSAAAGSVTGTVTLTSGTESDTVAINLPIAQLEKTDAEKLADAKKVAQTAVAGAAKAEDITEAAIKTAVNNADVAVKVESKVTKEATTTAEGETTVTVTLTVGTETDTVTRTFPIEKLTEEKPVTSDALWEGSVALGNWANSVQISGKDFTNFGAGTFVIELAPETGAQVALKYTATDWPVVPGCEEWYDVSGTKFEIEVTAEAMKAVGTNTLIVGGKNATIKKVTFVPAKTEAPEPDTTVEIDTSTTPVTKIESVDTKTDASGKVTEQIAYCAISEADAKNYDSYIVTITRGKDSKKFTQVIEDCFKAVQYESKDGKTVQVNAKDGSYCVLLDITGIGSDFGGITVTIAPNA